MFSQIFVQDLNFGVTERILKELSTKICPIFEKKFTVPNKNKFSVPSVKTLVKKPSISKNSSIFKFPDDSLVRLKGEAVLLEYSRSC